MKAAVLAVAAPVKGQGRVPTPGDPGSPRPGPPRPRPPAPPRSYNTPPPPPPCTPHGRDAQGGERRASPAATAPHAPAALPGPCHRQPPPPHRLGGGRRRPRFVPRRPHPGREQPPPPPARRHLCRGGGAERSRQPHPLRAGSPVLPLLSLKPGVHANEPNSAHRDTGFSADLYMSGRYGKLAYQQEKSLNHLYNILSVYIRPRGSPVSLINYNICIQLTSHDSYYSCSVSRGSSRGGKPPRKRYGFVLKEYYHV